MKTSRDRAYVAAVEKAIKVLSCVADSKTPVGITQLSKRLALSIGAVQRMTYTLSKLGYLRKATNNKEYILGFKAWALGLSIVSEIEVKNIAHPYLQDLSDKVGEIVSLGILEGTEMVYLDRIKTNHILNLNLNIGARLPAYSTSLGKAIVAFLPEIELAKILNIIDLKSLTRNTITNKKIFSEELRNIREKGFSINNAENDAGIRSVAAPVRDKSGRVIASINISVPSIRVSLQDLQTKLAQEVMSVAEIISQALGYKKEPF